MLGAADSLPLCIALPGEQWTVEKITRVKLIKIPVKSFVCWIFVLDYFISRCLNLLHQRVGAHAGADVPVKCKGFQLKERGGAKYG